MCGASLAAEPGQAGEERKIVSVLFTDLVGFTGRAEGLDPEDVRGMCSSGPNVAPELRIETRRSPRGEESRVVAAAFRRRGVRRKEPAVRLRNGGARRALMDAKGVFSNPPPLLEGLLNYYCPTSSQKRSSTKNGNKTSEFRK